MISNLINKKDSFEIIRDKIVEILVLEVVNQKKLAELAGEDPENWDLQVYKERHNPWEEYLNAEGDKSPIVHVWFDNESFDKSNSNISERQGANGVFNIDCYGYGTSASVEGAGHIAGDELAAEEAQRACKLVRNILMASEYTYLGIQKIGNTNIVGQRWVSNLQMFQPQIEGQYAQNVLGSRIALNVKYNEYSPQYAGATLEGVNVAITELPSGKVVFTGTYIYDDNDTFKCWIGTNKLDTPNPPIDGGTWAGTNEII